MTEWEKSKADLAERKTGDKNKLGRLGISRWVITKERAGSNTYSY